MSNKVHKKKKRKNRFPRFDASPTGGSAKLPKTRKVAGLPVIVDSEPIRQATRQAHEKIRARMEAMERQIDSFERQDLVAYERWLHLSFGPFLAELRESALAIAAKEDILDRVKEYQIWDNISAARAYAMVKSEIENPDIDPEPASDSDDFDDESDEDLHNLYEAASYMYEQETGCDAPDFESFKDALGIENTVAREKDNRTDSERARLKKLYRKIARSLHPDFSDSFSLREQRLWHRAQEAYKAGNLIALETVFSHIEAASAGPLFASTVSELMDSTREMRMRVEYLEEDLFQARQHPAWRFTQKTETQLGSLRKRIGKEIEQTLRQAKNDLAGVEAELQRIEIAHSRMTARERKKRQSKSSAETPAQTGFNF
jgi:hypothetical protein